MTFAWIRKTVITLVAVLVVGLITLDARAGNPEKPTLLGFATLNFRDDIPDFTSEAGRPPAIYQMFFSLETGWLGTKILTAFVDLGMTPLVEITADDLTKLNSGGWDADLNAMAATVADWLNQDSGRRILIAPLPEMNLLHPWGGNPDGFKDGYLRIREAFINQGLGPHQIRFIFAPNGTSDVGAYDDYYPGDSVVDLIGFAKINRGDPWRDYEVTFQMHIDELQATVSRAKPILITQTGSVTQNGNRETWLDDMFTKLKAHDQVIGAIYFNRDKGGGNDYRVLANGMLDPAFQNGYEQWSDPSEVSWIFDGRMDSWVQDRESQFASAFTDIDGHIFKNAIEWLADEGITQGCNPPTNNKFCPNDFVTRGEMAVFLVRALHYTDNGGGNLFIDDDGLFYENSADRLKTAKVTLGCNPPANNKYCGESHVTRGQMAAFLVRAMGYTDNGGGNLFVDDDGHLFENAIDKLGTAKVTLGCNPPTNDKFCPDDKVTRGQMAAFLKRALG